MGNLPIYNCPDITLYPYTTIYSRNYDKYVFELDGILQYFDNNNRLNEAYKKFLRFKRMKDDEKENFILELKNIKNILLSNTELALDKGYKIISIADPLSSLEFIGELNAKNYLDFFFLDFLYELKELCKNRAHIHLCPKLSILLIKITDIYKYKLSINKLISKTIYPSLLDLLLDKDSFSISGLKCIHYFGKINTLAFFELEKLY